MGKRFPAALRESMVRRMTGPEAMSACTLARETGIGQQTLSRWRAAARLGQMSDKKRRPEDWSQEEILAFVVEASGLPDPEIGAFLRKRGVHRAQLEDWKARIAAGLAEPGTKKSKKSPETRRIKELERELRRKDKALAEAAALLVLQKKVRAIWEDEDDDTTPPSDDGSSS